MVFFSPVLVTNSVGRSRLIVPFEIVYEDMDRRLTEVVYELAAFLGVALPPGPGPIRPRLRLIP